MNRVVGVLVTVLVLYVALLARDENARTWGYQETMAGWIGFWGVLTLGAGVLIISGGIDLSMGSVVGLGAVALGILLEKGVPAWLAILVVLSGSALIGLLHGLLVTKLHLQPFLVTLCGLFIYRGLARGASSVQVGLGGQAQLLKAILVGDVGEGGRNQVVVLLAAGAVLALILHMTRYGRYLFAIGANEEAARYAGVATDRYKIFAYVVCSSMAGLASVLFLLDNDSANPTSTGAFFELYAITGAVLGGCSLRGGEGSVPGMILGTAILPLLRGLCSFYGVPTDVEYAVIGFALLLGTVVDELLQRGWARRGG